MQRSFIHGDFRTVLEPALFERIAAERAADPLAECLVVVPSNLLRMHLRRRLAERGPHLGVRFVTLAALADELTLEVRAESGFARMPALAAQLLAGEVARSATPGSYFHSVKDTPGFAARLLATIRDVADAGLSPRDVAETTASRKVRDFAALMAEFERRRAAAGFAGDAELMALAARALAEPANAGGRADGACGAYVYGFYDFVGVQRRLIEALLHERRESVVFTPIPEGPAGEFGAPLLDRLRALGFTDATPPAATETTGPKHDLDLLRARLFRRERGEACRGDGSVTFRAPRFRGDEPREMLRAVRELVGRGLALHEIGVLDRRGDVAVAVAAAAASIESRLLTERDQRDGAAAAPVAAEPADCTVTPAGRVRFPVFLQGGRSIAQRQDARVLALLVDAMQALDRRSPARDLRPSFAFLNEAGVERRSMALERVARHAGIRGGGAGTGSWRDRLSAYEATLGRLEHEPDDEAINPGSRAEELLDARALRRAIEALESDADALASATTWSGAADVLRRSLRERARVAAGGPTDDVLDEIAALDRIGIGFDAQELAPLIARAVADGRERVGVFEQGLFAGALLAARGLSFRAVLLPALEDGVFPRRAAQDPILLDAERVAISRARLPAHEPGLPTTAHAPAEERLLLHLAVSAATESLVLSVPCREDGSDVAILPSTAMHDCAGALLGKPSLEVSPWRDPALARLTVSRERPSPANALDLVEWDRRTAELAADRGDGARLRYLAAIDRRLAAAIAGEQERGLAKRFTAHDGVLSPAIAEAVLAPILARPHSPTRLEDFARCPFVYYARVVLGVDEDDPRAADEPEFRDRGMLIHEVLRRFLDEATRSDAAWPPPESGPRFEALRDRLLAIGREELDRYRRASVAHPLMLRAEQLRLDDDLCVFLDFEVASGRRHRPTLLERAFGDDDAPPLVLGAGRSAQRIGGYIDRVDHDTATREAIVIDYKTGKPRDVKSIGTLDGGRRLQLPLYALAAQQLLGRGTAVAAAEYFHCTRRGGGKRVVAPRTLWEGAGRDALETTVAMLTRFIRGGAFFADPSDGDVCGGCAFQLACGLGAGLERRYARKADDPAMRQLMALRAAAPGLPAPSPAPEESEP